MTDVVEIAQKRKAKLAAEIGKLDNFINMAEALIKRSQSDSSFLSDTMDKNPAESNGPATARQSL